MLCRSSRLSSLLETDDTSQGKVKNGFFFLQETNYIPLLFTDDSAVISEPITDV